MRLLRRHQRHEPHGRHRWADLTAQADPQVVALASEARAVAAAVQADLAALVAEHDGQMPAWLRYVDAEDEEQPWR